MSDAPRVAVRFNGAGADYTASHAPTWSYLGGVSNYVFVYDHANGQALVLPVNAIASLRPVPAAKSTVASGPVAAKP